MAAACFCNVYYSKFTHVLTEVTLHSFSYILTVLFCSVLNVFLTSVAQSRPAVGEGANEHRALEYQGSGGLDRNSTCSPNDASAPVKLQQRSMSADSIVDLELDVAACRRQSGVEGSPLTDQPDRKRSGKLHEKWQQVKKVFTAKLDAGGTTPTTGGRTKTTPEKVPKSAAAASRSTRSASTACSTVGKSDEPRPLQLLTVQQPAGQHSRSVSPRTPSTLDGADSSSCRVQSNTGSSSVGLDNADRRLAGK